MIVALTATTAFATNSFSSAPSMACADYWLSRSYSESFDSAWEMIVTEGNASLTYGYNTWMVNEDDAWANHSELYHWAEITNATDNFRGPIKGPGTVSKKEVTHAGTFVTYYCNWG